MPVLHSVKLLKVGKTSRNHVQVRVSSFQIFFQTGLLKHEMINFFLYLKTVVCRERLSFLGNTLNILLVNGAALEFQIAAKWRTDVGEERRENLKSVWWKCGKHPEMTMKTTVLELELSLTSIMCVVLDLLLLSHISICCLHSFESTQPHWTTQPNK